MTNTIIIGFVLLAFVVGFMISGNTANAAENLNTKLYYNEEYSFSIEYPTGWGVDDTNVIDNIVSFMDGSEECMSFTSDSCLWNTNIIIFKYLDLGKKLSDTEERQWQIDSTRELCNNATYGVDGHTCRNFTVVNELPSTTTIEGYPIITTVFSMTKDFPEDASPDLKLMNTVSFIYVGNDVWDISTESKSDVFSQHEKYIINAISTFKLSTSPQGNIPAIPEPPTSVPPNGGGCLIATATYGSELAPQVQQLRELRDNTLLNTESGTNFMESFNDFYYSFSPYIADYERENPIFKEVVKIAITPMISSLSILNYVDIDSEESVLVYGISLIVLNGMMYVGIPASVIIVIRRF